MFLFLLLHKRRFRDKYLNVSELGTLIRPPPVLIQSTKPLQTQKRSSKTLASKAEAKIGHVGHERWEHGSKIRSPKQIKEGKSTNARTKEEEEEGGEKQGEQEKSGRGIGKQPSFSSRRVPGAPPTRPRASPSRPVWSLSSTPLPYLPSLCALSLARWLGAENHPSTDTDEELGAKPEKACELASPR